MREDFAAFILTHGRPNKVRTYESLKKSGYTGPVFIVIDDEDKRADEYRAKFGDAVIQFSKAKEALSFDEGDNFDDRRAIIYARNACFGIAKSLGFRYFIQLDDDYYCFHLRTENRSVMIHRTLDDLFEAMVLFHEASGALSVAMSQGGDHIGGVDPRKLRSLKRKAMNTFVCSVDRPFKFSGRINEDVNTYTSLSRLGGLFFTVMQAQMDQQKTQQSSGGMTELYLDSGTYIKSFYSVIFCPSGVKIGELRDAAYGNNHRRIHHRVNWDAVAPRILSEKHVRSS